MKKLIVISILLIMCISVSVFAAERMENTVISKDETRTGIVTLAGTTVVNDGTIDDDFIAAGQSVINNGHVNGDIIAAGRTLSLVGNTRGNIRAAGYDITLKGITAKNATIAANTISIDKSAVIYGTTMAAAQTVTVSGTLNRPLYAAGENIIIDGVVAGDVQVDARMLTVLPGAKISGNLSYASDNDANVAPGTVAGTVTKKAPVITAKEFGKKAEFTIANIFSKLWWIAGSFLLGALLIKIFGMFFKDTPGTISASWLKYLGIGILTLIVIPVASIILLVTVVGIPIAIVSIVGYVLLIFLAKIPVSIFIGDLILKDKNIYLKLLAGLSILGLVYLIPYLGGLACFVVMLTGLGLLVYNIFFVRKAAVAPVE